MKRRLPDAVRDLRPVEKLVWLYVDRYPGEHSINSLEDALGVDPGRALASLRSLGLIEELEAATRSKGGRYRAVPIPTSKAAG